MDTGGDDVRLRGVDEDAHEGGGKETDHHADKDAEERRGQPCAADAPADAVGLACAVVLGHIGGEGIAEILHRHIGEGVDLHRRCEGRHDDRAEAVHEALHHQNAEVHDGLLDAGHDREVQDGRKVLLIPAAVLPPGAKLREFFQGIDADADARYQL